MANGFITQQSDRSYPGSTSNLSILASMITGQQFTMPGSGAMTVSELGVYCDDSGAAGSSAFRLGLLSDASGQPGTLIGESGELTVDGAAQWVAATGLSITGLTGGTAYWLVVYPGAHNNFDFEGFVEPGGTSFTSTTAQHGQTYPTWPSSAPTHTDRTYDLGIYAVYAAAGGTAIPVFMHARAQQ